MRKVRDQPRITRQDLVNDLKRSGTSLKENLWLEGGSIWRSWGWKAVLSGEAGVGRWVYLAKGWMSVLRTSGSVLASVGAHLCGHFISSRCGLSRIGARMGSSSTEGRNFPASLGMPGVHPSYADR